MKPETLQRTAQEATTARAVLHHRIRLAHADGMSLRRIAGLVGLNHETVRTIVKEGESSETHHA